jgi:ubiquitin C-terminal hydrolase
MLRNIKRSGGVSMTSAYMKTRLAKWNSTHQTHAWVHGVLRATTPAGSGATCGLWRNSVSGNIVRVSQGTLATLSGGWTVSRVKQRWGPSGREHQPGPNDTELVRFSFNSASDGSLVLPEEAFWTWKYFAVPFQLEWSHNNCWLATALQALCACPQFLDTWRRPQLAQRSDLQDSQHAEKVAVAVPAFLSGVFATASHAPNGALIAQLRLQLAVHRPNLSGDSMHDVAEVMLWLLDRLHSDTTANNTAEASSRILPHSTCDDTDAIVLAEEHAWNELHNSSPTASLFRGMMRTKIDCTQCARSTRRFETFTIVCFAIPPPPPPPPPSASSDSTDAGSTRAAQWSLEQLVEANMIHHKELMADGVDCPDCNARTKHTRKDTIVTTPTYLIIQVKRWTKEGEKIKGQITSPPVLNMHSCVTAPAGAGSNVYRRVAIVEHRDGHYTAYVTRDADRFLCDGSRVTLVSDAAMNSCHDAYVFVYARVAPGGPV